MMFNLSSPFFIEKIGDKLDIFDNKIKIWELSVDENFSFRTKYGKTNCNCAIIAAATGGVAIAVGVKGFETMLGCSLSGVESLFELAASGATMAEVTSAIIELIGFWAFLGLGVGIVG